MSNERNAKTNPSTAERVGGSVKKPEQPRGDEPDFKTLFHAWLESHRASLVDSVGRLLKQPIGSFFTCLVMAVALSLPMGWRCCWTTSSGSAVPGSALRRSRCSCSWTSTPPPAMLRDQVAGMPDVAEADWISREQALKSSSSYPASARRSRSCRRTRCPASSW